MMSHLHDSKQMPQEVQLLYSSRISESGRIDFIFRKRIKEIANSTAPEQFKLQLFATGDRRIWLPRRTRIEWRQRRIQHKDLIAAIGSPKKRAGVVCYVCGPPPMTDDFVSLLRHAEGMEEQRVLCEKWW